MGLNYEVRCGDTEESTSLWQQGVGDPAGRCGFPPEMCGLRSSDHGGT